jgi:MerR family redox-sensitive transcriptional activator SoxR
MDQHELLTIGEVARKVGVRTSALRFYERRGLLPVPKRVNGHRRYQRDVIQKIRLIQMAQRAGFTVGEIRMLLYESSQDTPPLQIWQVHAGRKLDEIDELLGKVKAMKSLLEQTIACQCDSLNDCAGQIPE